MSKDVRTTASSPARAPSNGRRWLAAAIVPVAVVAVAVAVPAVADSTPSLPEKTAQEVLELVADSADATYSGTIEQQAELGLPELPAMGPGSSSDSAVGSALELLTGAHTARVYVGSAETARLQLMDTLAQRDVVISGSDMWFYSSATNEAVHVLLPDETSASPDSAAPDPTVLPPGLPSTPAELAQTFLDTIDPSTTVEVGDTARVAGRPVYTLTLTPTTEATLVDSVVLSVDSDTGLPLAVSVAAAGQEDPAFAVEFSSISFEAPDAELFTFTPPEGATVTEKDLTDVAADRADAAAGEDTNGSAPDQPLPDAALPVVVGEGWASILVIPADALAAVPDITGDIDSTDESSTDESSDPAEGQQLLDQFTTAVPEGRLFESALVSALLTTDGRVIVGAVSGAQLQAAAQSTP